jgi:hypothetical protein
MISVATNLSVTITGNVQGIGTDTTRSNGISSRNDFNGTQGGTGSTLVDEVLDLASNDRSITIAASATTTVDLTSGETDPLGGAVVFARIRRMIFIHPLESLASSVTVFNAASNAFQGPLSAAGTQKNIKILNNDATNAATFSYYADGATV